MYVNIRFLQLSGLFRHQRPCKAQRDLHRLLHHVPKLPRDQQLPRTRHLPGLDEQDVAAGGRPRKPRHHARRGGFLHQLFADRRHIQKLPKVFICHEDRRLPAADELYGRAPADAVEPFFQSPDTCLAGILLNDFRDHLLGNRQVVLGKPGLLPGLRQKMPDGDLPFFDRRVALEPDHLHAV